MASRLGEAHGTDARKLWNLDRSAFQDQRRGTGRRNEERPREGAAAVSRQFATSPANATRGTAERLARRCHVGIVVGLVAALSAWWPTRADDEDEKPVAAGRQFKITNHDFDQRVLAAPRFGLQVVVENGVDRYVLGTGSAENYPRMRMEIAI